MFRTALGLVVLALLATATPAKDKGVSLTVHLHDVVHGRAVGGEIRLYRIGLPAEPKRGLAAGDEVVGEFRVEPDSGTRIGGLVEGAEYRVLALSAAAGTPARAVHPRGKESKITIRAAFPRHRLLELRVLGPKDEPVTTLDVQFFGGSCYGSSPNHPPWFRPRMRLPAGEVPGDAREGTPIAVASETGTYRVTVYPGDTRSRTVRYSWRFQAEGMAPIYVNAGGDVGPVLRATARTVPVAEVLAVVRTPNGKPVHPERAEVRAWVDVGWIGWVEGTWRDSNDAVEVRVKVKGYEPLRFRYPVDGRKPELQVLAESKRTR